MRLFIAEKPSLAKAIAQGLSQPVKKEGQALLCGDDVVVWCLGHVMSLANPDVYDPKYKSWNLSDLPIIPDVWQLEVSNPDLFKTIKRYIKKADIIVNAGDPDKEGQLLVDEVIEYIGTKAPIKRVLINDYNLPAVQKALSEIQDNENFKGLSDSALARSHADWLYGLNMTRLYTMLGKNGGYTEVLSVGRVQTPILGLVVRRDLEIANFKSKPFYTLSAMIRTANGSFKANWKAGKNAEAYLDEEGRLINPSFATEVQNQVNLKKGLISSLEVKDKKEQPPLCFALKDIQILASKKLDLSPHQTLEIIQSLYETHKIITYPRSDCSYLPEGHLLDKEDVLNAIATHFPSLMVEINGADTSIRSKVWNDEKITAHHGIIPTPNSSQASLSNDEKAVYELIAFRYVLQFYPAFEYQQTSIKIVAENELFTASGRVIKKSGWKELEKKKQQQQDQESQDQENDESLSDENKDLPRVQENEAVLIESIEASTKKTTPPKPFNDASLLAAMSGISKYVTDLKVKQLLKDTDGLGTPATQGSIIKTLFDRNFLVKKGKVINSTEIGRSLIGILPKDSTVPDMTAFWELAMSKIESGEMSLSSFIAGVENQINKLVNQGRALGKLTIAGVKVYKCPKCDDGNLSRRKGKSGFFWGCSNYPDCSSTFEDIKGQPKTTADPSIPCPVCNKGELRRLKAKRGHFWGCSRYKDGCKNSLPDLKGKPVFKKIN